MASLLFMLLSSSSVVYPVTCLSAEMMEWSDAVVAREGTLVTLVCIDENATGAVSVNWMVKTLGTDQWKLVLTASERKEFSGRASKEHMHLTDHNFQDSGVFSLGLRPQMEDGGLYMCLVKRRLKVLKERVILLIVLQVTLAPPSPVPQLSTLRLIASVRPELAVTKITWAAPGDLSMRTEKVPRFGIITKLPQVQNSDEGAYVCMVFPKGNSSNPFYAFNVDVDVDAADREPPFASVVHGDEISTAVEAESVFLLTCPKPPGDFVLLYWRPSDTRQSATKLVHQFDRWRGFTSTEHNKRLQLAGPPYNAQAGSFSYLLTPTLKDGGMYICDIYSNDNRYSQRTVLTVVKVKARRLSTELELDCRYSELSQVLRASWTHPNQSVHLHMDGSPGSITTSVPLPVRAESAGNYTCEVLLKNKQTVRATYPVSLPPTTITGESVEVAASSLLPSLSALLLMVPLVALVVGAFLWRRRHIADRGIEQSLSVRSGEAENIYENPEDIRQAPPQGSVYMDLKPRGEDDVYKELERYEQCQSR